MGASLKAAKENPCWQAALPAPWPKARWVVGVGAHIEAGGQAGPVDALQEARRALPLAEYDVIKALPASVTTRPLGLVEERAPKAARPVPGGEPEIDLSARSARRFQPNSSRRKRRVIATDARRLDNRDQA